MLEITGFHKFIERDNYENGCIGQAQGYFIDYPIKAETLDGLKRQILSFIDADEDSIEINACDDDGRIDVCKQENDEGYTPSRSEYERFKSGEIDLWYAHYSCYVEKVERKSIRLGE